MRAFAVAAVVALAGCAQPVDVAGVSPPVAASDAPIAFYTAGPGDVMAVSDRCAISLCGDEAGADAERYGVLRYLGMRSPTEAVFERRLTAVPPEGLEATAARGLFAPAHRAVPAAAADFIAPRPGAAASVPGVVEIVVDPVAGVAFGTEAFEIAIASATPARVVYTLSPAF